MSPAVYINIDHMTLKLDVNLEELPFWGHEGYLCMSQVVLCCGTLERGMLVLLNLLPETSNGANGLFEVMELKVNLLK